MQIYIADASAQDRERVGQLLHEAFPDAVLEVADTAELDAARRLQEVSIQLIEADGIDALYQRILDTAVAIHHADFGSIQVFHPELGEAGELHLLRYYGLSGNAANLWGCITPASGTICALALGTKQRVMAPDLDAYDLELGPGQRDLYAQAGIRAAQSTPLLSRSGTLLGMLSTHWREPYNPPERELRALDILARLSADLIERTKAEAVLRDSEARLQRQTVELKAERARLAALVTDVTAATREVENLARFPGENPNPVLRVSHEGRLLYANAASAPVLAEWRRAVGQRVPEFWQGIVARALTAEAPISLDVSVQAQTFAFLVVPIGGTDYVNVYAHDITKRVRSEQALRGSEARYRTLFESIDEGFCVIEMLFDAEDRPIDYRFLEANPVFERQSGFAIKEGVRMRQIAPNHETHWFEIYGRVAKTGEPVRFQNHAEAFDRYYDLYAFRVGEPEQRRVGVLFTDITKRKKAEADLRRYAAELEAVNQANRVLLQEVNHRVKNSLTAILGLIFAEERRLTRETMPCFRSSTGQLELAEGTVPSAVPGPCEDHDPATHVHCLVALRNLRDRLGSLAGVHTLLSANAWHPLPVDELVDTVVHAAASTLAEPANLTLEITGSRVVVSPEQAHHLALVISELTTNTLKHGCSEAGAHIQVDIGLENGDVRLVYRNQGPAYPEPVVAGDGYSVGLDIVDKLVRHSLRGTWTISNEGGPVTEIRFPADSQLK